MLESCPPLIDADCHVVEPFSLWQELPEPYRLQARRRVVDYEGVERIEVQGRKLDLEWTVGALSTPGSGSAGGRLDVDLDTETDPGAWDPQRRVELMDEQGIAVSVLFPSITLGLDDIADIGFRGAQARLYNSWVAEFCGYDPVRLRWAAVLPLADLDWAMAELERVLEAGASAVMLSPLPQSGPGTLPFASPERERACYNLGHSRLDPLWRAIIEADVAAAVHAVNPASNGLGLGWVFANRGQWQMGQPFQLQLAMLHILDGKVLERFPDLRVGFLEGDVGWLPHWLGRLSSTYQKFALLSDPPKRSVIDQFREQCTICGEPADLGLAHTVDLVGARSVMWGSDWPHMDGAWPDPAILLRDRADLDEEDKRTIFFRAAARFYGIDLDELCTHLGPGWSQTAPLDAVAGLGTGGV